MASDWRPYKNQGRGNKQGTGSAMWRPDYKAGTQTDHDGPEHICRAACCAFDYFSWHGTGGCATVAKPFVLRKRQEPGCHFTCGSTIYPGNTKHATTNENTGHHVSLYVGVPKKSAATDWTFAPAESHHLHGHACH